MLQVPAVHRHSYPPDFMLSSPTSSSLTTGLGGPPTMASGIPKNGEYGTLPGSSTCNLKETPRTASSSGSSRKEDVMRIPFLVKAKRGRRPKPPRTCASCLTGVSSQWRSGPNGEALCNRCGIAFRRCQQSGREFIPVRKQPARCRKRGRPASQGTTPESAPCVVQLDTTDPLFVRWHPAQASVASPKLQNRTSPATYPVTSPATLSSSSCSDDGAPSGAQSNCSSLELPQSLPAVQVSSTSEEVAGLQHRDRTLIAPSEARPSMSTLGSGTQLYHGEPCQPINVAGSASYHYPRIDKHMPAAQLTAVHPTTTYRSEATRVPSYETDTCFAESATNRAAAKAQVRGDAAQVALPPISDLLGPRRVY